MSGRTSHKQLATILKELIRRPLTIREMSRIGGLSYQGARFWAEVLRQTQLAHITGYVKTPRSTKGSRLYAWGYGKDAKNPKLTPLEVSRRHAAKKHQLDHVWRSAT